MSYTDQQLLGDLQRLMIEPTVDDGVSWESGLWTLEEVLGYANQRQQRFLAETCLTGGWYEQAAPATEIQTLDADVVYVQHAIFETPAAPIGVCQPLYPFSRFSADLAMPGWDGQPGTPQGFLFEQTGTLTLSLVPPPSAPGTLHLFAVVLGEVLDRSGVLLSVPDEWVPAVRFGILHDMLSKQGYAYDQVRADYCLQRWQEGVASAKALLEALL